MIELKVDEGILLKRIEKRVAEMTARGEKVRADDNPEVLKGRLDAYRAQTAPLVDYYAGKGMLKSVDGMAPIDDVTAAIDRLLGPAKARPQGQAGRQGRGQGRRPRAQARKAKPAKSAKAKAKSRPRRAGQGARPKAANAGKAQGARPAASRPRKSDKPGQAQKLVPAEVDEGAMNPLISCTFRSLTRCRAPERRGRVSCYALRYPLPGTRRIRRVAAPPAGNRREIRGPYRRRQYSDQQARRDRASVYPWHRPARSPRTSWSKVNLPIERRVSQLTDAEVLQIREMIDRDYMVEGDLRRETAMNIKRLMDLGCYRGLRHRKGLPVRGQRTHTNARTRKGPAKAIAGKKK